MSERAPRGMIAFAVSEGLAGGLLLAVGGVNAFMWLSYALSQSLRPATDLPTLIDSGLLGTAGLLGVALVLVAAGLVTAKRWAVPLGLATQVALMGFGVVLGIKSAGLGLIMSFAVGLVGLLYLTSSGFSMWPPRHQSTTSPRLVVWLRGALLVAACMEFGVIMGSPMGVLLVGLQAVSGEPGLAPNLGVLAGLLLWLGVQAGLEVWFLKAAASPGSAWLPGHAVVVTIALGALLPWAGWLRPLPILAALALETVLIYRPSRVWLSTRVA